MSCPSPYYGWKNNCGLVKVSNLFHLNLKRKVSSAATSFQPPSSPTPHSNLLLLALLPHWTTSLVHSPSLSHQQCSYSAILVHRMEKSLFFLSQIKHIRDMTSQETLPGGGDNMLPISQPVVSWGSTYWKSSGRLKLGTTISPSLRPSRYHGSQPSFPALRCSESAHVLCFAGA